MHVYEWCEPGEDYGKLLNTELKKAHEILIQKKKQLECYEEAYEALVCEKAEAIYEGCGGCNDCSVCG